MSLRVFLIAAAAVLVPVGAASAQGWATAPAYANTIRFPGYDPRLGSLEGYRAALIEAVDRHIAAVSAGYAGAYYGAAHFNGATVGGLVVAPAPRSGDFDEQVRRLDPATHARGVMTGAVGVTEIQPLSSNRHTR